MPIFELEKVAHDMGMTASQLIDDMGKYEVPPLEKGKSIDDQSLHVYRSRKASGSWTAAKAGDPKEQRAKELYRDVILEIFGSRDASGKYSPPAQIQYKKLFQALCQKPHLRGRYPKDPQEELLMDILKYDIEIVLEEEEPPAIYKHAEKETTIPEYKPQLTFAEDASELNNVLDAAQPTYPATGGDPHEKEFVPGSLQNPGSGNGDVRQENPGMPDKKYDLPECKGSQERKRSNGGARGKRAAPKRASASPDGDGHRKYAAPEKQHSVSRSYVSKDAMRFHVIRRVIEKEYHGSLFLGSGEKIAEYVFEHPRMRSVYEKQGLGTRKAVREDFTHLIRKALGKNRKHGRKRV